MNYGYIRVSTDKQTVENQRFEISRFCEKEGIAIDCWVEETISGTKEPEKRKLGKFLKRICKGDIIICAELSRLGRSLLMIMAILNECLKREAQVWTIKDNYRLGSDISSKVLAFAFGLSAEIERNLISQRTTVAVVEPMASATVLRLEYVPEIIISKIAWARPRRTMVGTSLVISRISPFCYLQTFVILQFVFKDACYWNA